MTRVFFDSSAFLAAVFSSTGAAYELVQMAARGEIEIFISQDVIIETKRNLERKAPELVIIFDALLQEDIFEVIAQPSKQEVWAAEKYVVPKDAFIIAAAINAHVDYLVTFDRKHLIDPKEVASLSGLTILTPGTLFKML